MNSVGPQLTLSQFIKLREGQSLLLKSDVATAVRRNDIGTRS